jgi:type VI secretion system protein ImpK
MNLNFLKKPGALAVDIDALLHDSYLLVVELRQGASVHDTAALQRLCLDQVEQVRQQLEQIAMEPRNIEHISHAQCALLDEAILVCTEGPVRDEWTREPLQARLFNRHQAGEFLYEEMQRVLREPSPDPRVLTVFHRVLMLGFKGRYTDPDDPRCTGCAPENRPEPYHSKGRSPGPVPIHLEPRNSGSATAHRRLVGNGSMAGRRGCFPHARPGVRGL